MRVILNDKFSLACKEGDKTLKLLKAFVSEYPTPVIELKELFEVDVNGFLELDFTGVVDKNSVRVCVGSDDLVPTAGYKLIYVTYEDCGSESIAFIVLDTVITGGKLDFTPLSLNLRRNLIQIPKADRILAHLILPQGEDLEYLDKSSSTLGKNVLIGEGTDLISRGSWDWWSKGIEGKQLELPYISNSGEVVGSQGEFRTYSNFKVTTVGSIDTGAGLTDDTLSFLGGQVEVLCTWDYVDWIFKNNEAIQTSSGSSSGFLGLNTELIVLTGDIELERKENSGQLVYTRNETNSHRTCDIQFKLTYMDLVKSSSVSILSNTIKLRQFDGISKWEVSSNTPYRELERRVYLFDSKAGESQSFTINCPIDVQEDEVSLVTDHPDVLNFFDIKVSVDERLIHVEIKTKLDNTEDRSWYPLINQEMTLTPISIEAIGSREIFYCIQGYNQPSTYIYQYGRKVDSVRLLGDLSESEIYIVGENVVAGDTWKIIATDDLLKINPTKGFINSIDTDQSEWVSTRISSRQIILDTVDVKLGNSYLVRGMEDDLAGDIDEDDWRGAVGFSRLSFGAIITAEEPWVTLETTSINAARLDVYKFTVKSNTPVKLNIEVPSEGDYIEGLEFLESRDTIQVITKYDRTNGVDVILSTLEITYPASNFNNLPLGTIKLTSILPDGTEKVWEQPELKVTQYRLPPIITSVDPESNLISVTNYSRDFIVFLEKAAGRLVKRVSFHTITPVRYLLTGLGGGNGSIDVGYDIGTSYEKHWVDINMSASAVNNYPAKARGYVGFQPVGYVSESERPQSEAVRYYLYELGDAPRIKLTGTSVDYLDAADVAIGGGFMYIYFNSVYPIKLSDIQLTWHHPPSQGMLLLDLIDVVDGNYTLEIKTLYNNQDSGSAVHIATLDIESRIMADDFYEYGNNIPTLNPGAKFTQEQVDSIAGVGRLRYELYQLGGSVIVSGDRSFIPPAGAEREFSLITESDDRIVDVTDIRSNGRCTAIWNSVSKRLEVVYKSRIDDEGAYHLTELFTDDTQYIQYSNMWNSTLQFRATTDSYTNPGPHPIQLVIQQSGYVYGLVAQIPGLDNPLLALGDNVEVNKATVQVEAGVEKLDLVVGLFDISSEIKPLSSGVINELRIITSGDGSVYEIDREITPKLSGLSNVSLVFPKNSTTSNQTRVYHIIETDNTGAEHILELEIIQLKKDGKIEVSDVDCDKILVFHSSGHYISGKEIDTFTTYLTTDLDPDDLVIKRKSSEEIEYEIVYYGPAPNEGESYYQVLCKLPANYSHDLVHDRLDIGIKVNSDEYISKLSWEMRQGWVDIQFDTPDGGTITLGKVDTLIGRDPILMPSRNSGSSVGDRTIFPVIVLVNEFNTETGEELGERKLDPSEFRLDRYEWVVVRDEQEHSPDAYLVEHESRYFIQDNQVPSVLWPFIENTYVTSPGYYRLVVDIRVRLHISYRAEDISEWVSNSNALMRLRKIGE